MRSPLVSSAAARALDAEASASWGLSPAALVEAAGRSCARRLIQFYKEDPASRPAPRRILVLAGGGNNGADALVMLRSLILEGEAAPSSSLVLGLKIPAGGSADLRSDAFRSLEKMAVPCRPWGGAVPEPSSWDCIIDGIAGTGLRGPLEGAPKEMAEALAALSALRGGVPGRRGPGPLIVSVDLPSGNFDGWEPGMPLVEADLTLGIEPLKTCLYAPAARVYGGRILKAGGIFPPALMEAHRGAELVDWEAAAAAIPPVRPDAYKHRRGIVEIHAGSPGALGAARIAARGAQAAGAGLVRLMAGRETYPFLASDPGGIMTVPPERDDLPGRFKADALLLGPGWGRGAEQQAALEAALLREAEATPLVLDADGIHLGKDRVFHGRALLTPHPGEFAALAEGGAGEALCRPGPALLEAAREKQAYILFKSCVLIAAAPDGRLAYLDGMIPALAAGGTGDLLSGFCAALAARTAAEGGAFDGYRCALAAAALLLEAARRKALDKKFIDPLELASAAAEIAGSAWL